ncbi:pseudouridine synthase [Bosea sp. (in: a-proteobacteria)]|jgi:23S rRNA pseudouridine2605 synthase|uniref:pseudouridine synthase n=1 Tax=Bosea sp. (in: a-proteobacteria) TaxID=1871050 RepID=UPI002DDDA50E|nr:pseudouridine synthase [Bosea sp. (in: a-proteobacteria)]HEV2509222.1 pseudouridine synthase [Bosea sp. (in: a-proteobacteria)]
MSDDNNQKSRGPRKGGGTGGRGGGRDGGPGRGGPGGRPPGRGGKPPFRSRDGEERPRRAPTEGAERRSEGERPARRFEKKPFGDRPPREGGERPFRDRGGDERRTSRPPRDGDRPSRERTGGDRPGGFGRPSRDGAPSRPPRDGDRPLRGRGDDERRAARPAREGGERPFRSRDGEERRPPRDRGDQPGRSERPFRERSGSGERPARPPRRDDRGEGRSFGGGKRFDAPHGSNPTRSRPDRAHRNAAEIAEAVSVPAAPQEPERIAKVMARAGVASRRDSEALIAEGRVSVNGKVIESPALDVGPNDVVLVDGEPLPARERTRLWFYHKPRGLVTTNHDPEGRPTVFDALPEDLPRVLSVGRLDINTEGLLLLTNDGGLARMLELPETGWLRRYRVRAFGQVNQAQLDTLRGGVTIDGVQYGPVIAQFEREQGSNTWLTVDLREGKNREVKTVLEHLGLQVNRLIRVSFGPFQLGDLPEGEAEEVRSRVLKDQLGAELMAKAGVDFDSPRRDEIRSDERPARGRPAPAGDDRPRRRPREEQAEEARPLRGDKPWTRGVWRDVEAEPQRERKAPPRRGADPKEERQAREATGAVTRVRDKAIADPKGRRVKVERISAKPKDEPREDRPARAPRGERPARTPREESFGRDRGGESPWRGSGDWADKPPRGKRPPSGGPGTDERPARPFRGKPSGDRPGGDRPGGRGPRPGGGRPPRSGPPRSGGGRDRRG